MKAKHRVVGIIISGTFAPDISSIYYEPLINICNNFCDQTYFETIPSFGLNAIEETVDHFEKIYFHHKNTKYILVGHSQGGCIAGLLAMRHPEMVITVISLASPHKGTTLVDPINMPVRAAVEMINILSLGKIKLRPKIRPILIPVFPIVNDLAAHAEMSEKLCEYLENQLGGHTTHAFIGTGDLFVFPHRSANPIGPNVTSYIVAPLNEYQRLLTILPDGLVHIDAHVGHLMIVRKKEVLEKISQILQDTTKILTTQS